MTLRARFFAKVDPAGPVHPTLGTACHLWTGARGPVPFDYGTIYTGGKDGWAHKVERAHRVAWFLATGEIPPDQVLHRCDVPRCVNPDHLFLGSHDDNMADKKAKGRAAHDDRTNLGPKNPARGERHGSRAHPELVPRGERNGSARLTEADVLAIREARGVHYRDLAARYGITPAAVGYIRRGETWAHVGGPREGPCADAPPPPTKPRLTPAETLAAIVALLPPEDRGGSRRYPDKPFRWTAIPALAKRLGVHPSMVYQALREGATLDLIERWRAAIDAPVYTGYPSPIEEYPLTPSPPCSPLLAAPGVSGRRVLGDDAGRPSLAVSVPPPLDTVQSGSADGPVGESASRAAPAAGTAFLSLEAPHAVR